MPHSAAPSLQETLPCAQWSVCFGAHQTGCAVKGGHNGEPHNHNDVGSFHYVIGDEVFFADLGAGEYTREYFQEQTRYTIFVNQSQSHNVPIIAGHGQMPGLEYRCSLFETDGSGCTKLRLEDAYGETGLKSFLRTLDFSGVDGTLRVTDTFTGDAALAVTENLVTPWRPEIAGSKITLCGKSHCCILTLHTQADIQVKEQIYSDHHGNPRTVYQIQWPVPMDSGTAATHFEISAVSQA